MKSLNSLQPVGLLALRPGDADLLCRARPAGILRVHSGVIEVFGAILLALGVFPRVAALLLALETGVAIWKVHSAGGYFAVHNYEFPLAMLAASFALATVGAGRLSLDHPLFERGG